MNIRDFSKKVSAKALNESLTKKFGAKIELDKFTTEQLYDARNKIRTDLSQIQTTESYDSVNSDKYQKQKMFLDVINAEIRERDSGKEVSESVLREGPEEVAELVMAAKSMVDRITSWMEDTSEMETSAMLDLADEVRNEFGDERASKFTATVRPGLQELYNAMEETRRALTKGVGLLSGEMDPDETLGDDDPELDLDDIGDIDPDVDAEKKDDLDFDDDFGASGAATDGADEREKRESIDWSKKK